MVNARMLFNRRFIAISYYSHVSLQLVVVSADANSDGNSNERKT